MRIRLARLWDVSRGTPAALLATASAGALFWWRFNATPPASGQLFPFDLVNYYYPRSAAVARRLLAGELPLWNPDLCAGLPELATAQTAVLSPQTWLFAVSPVEPVLPLRMAIECLLGGFFAVLFMRRLELDAVAAALGGVLFLATCLLGQTFWPPVVSTLLWLPWLLYCVESLARGWRWSAWLGLVAGTALQWLAGFPQFAAYSFLLAGPYALLRVLTLCGASAAALRTLAEIAAAVALGLGVAGAQLLPTAELAGVSTRAQTLTASDAHYLPADLDARGVLRNAIDPAPKLLSFDYRDGGNYLGIATLLLVVVGAALGPPLLVWPLLLFAALALLSSDGFHGIGDPLYRALVRLPVLGAFRAPERLRVLTLVSVITVACVGLHQVGHGLAIRSRRRNLATALAVGLAAAMIAAAGAPGAALRAALAVALLAAAAFARNAAWRRGCAVLLLLFAVGDVLAATAVSGSFRELPTGWTSGPYLQGAPVSNADAVASLQRAAGWQRVEVENPYFAPAMPRERLRCIDPLTPRAFASLFDASLAPGARQTFYDAASVRWLLRLRSDASGVWLEPQENPGALPRAYWIERGATALPDATLERLQRGDFDPRAVVELDRGGEAPVASASPLGPQPARILLREAERVELEVDAPRAGFLVLTDAWYPGWRATRDGHKTDVLRANALFRAVRVPAGRSRVVFEYHPQSFRRGVALSAVSLALAVGAPLVARARRRRDDAPR